MSVATHTKLCTAIIFLCLCSTRLMADECEPFLFLNCPGSHDQQSFVDGCTAQVNGATSGECGPSPANSSWDWGDSSAPNSSFFPGSHDYSQIGRYTLTVTIGPFTETCPIEVTECGVAIDIKPGSYPNCFNINGHGVVPVAILGSNTFDVTNIDVNTVSFGGFDLRLRGNRDPMCSLDDTNGDGRWDLICHFEDDPSAWTAGESEATLMGELFDGTRFEGTDSICVVPRGRR